MPFLPTCRWALFLLYIAAFFAIPLGILWDLTGLFAGLGLALAFVIALRWNGTRRIARQLGLHEVYRAEAPLLFAMAEEYARRLDVPRPRIAILPSPAINLAAFALSRQDGYLVVTDGALRRLSRDQLSALVGRELSLLWHVDSFLESWLALFLGVLDTIVAPARRQSRRPRSTKRPYPFALFLREIIVYPLAIVPVWLLKMRMDEATLDNRAARLSRLPRHLAEGLRLIEAFQERVPLKVPFSTRRLFLSPPPATDPLARIFFTAHPLRDRIRELEGTSLTTGAAC